MKRTSWSSELRVKSLAAELATTLKQDSGKVAGMLKKNGLEWKNTGPFSFDRRYITGLGSDEKLRGAAFALTKDNNLTEKPIESAGYHYILKLKTRTDADMAKLDSKKVKELRDTGSYMEGYRIYSALTASLNKEYRDGGKIQENPEYRDYDQQGQRN